MTIEIHKLWAWILQFPLALERLMEINLGQGKGKRSVIGG